MPHFYLAIDQGTTSCRAILFDEKFNIEDKIQQEFTQYFPNPGWVEHNPSEILKTQLSVIKLLLLKTCIKADEINSIGITNQRETLVLWDKTTGKPIYNAIVWQDTRTAERCNKLKKSKWGKIIHEKTGLIIDPYFSASKAEWIIQNVSSSKQLIEENRLLFGTIDTWLLWNLTNGKVHATDVSNASRTMLFNINTMDWDDDLLSLFGIPKSILPEIKSNVADFGTTDPTVFMGKSIKITAMAGDQQSSLFGHACFSKGMLKNTYGTGCFMMINTGNKPIFSQNGLLTTLAWQINGITTYATEGSVFIAGAGVQWVRDNLGLIQKSSEIEALAMAVEDTAGTYFVPAFAGLGAPYWNTNAKGALLGISRSTRKEHIARAVLEAIAFQTKDVMEVIIAETKQKITSIFVDGGAAGNNFLMQFQSDILNLILKRSNTNETTAKGVAMMASLGCGNSIENLHTESYHPVSFTPKMNESERTKLYKAWINVVKSVDYHSKL